jgi:hypothetical protein
MQSIDNGSVERQAPEPRIGAIINKPESPKSLIRLPAAIETTSGQRSTFQPLEADATFDMYDPVNLRIDQTNINQIAAKKLLLTVRVKKPGKQEWFRVHPDPEYRVTVALFQEEGESIEKETFLILPSARAYLLDNEYSLNTLYLYVTTQNNPGIWAVRLPDGRKNDWQSTAAAAVELAMTKWVRIAANMTNRANDVFEAPGDIHTPVWPEKSMRELIHLAFKDHVIADGNHPMIQKLRTPVV